MIKRYIEFNESLDSDKRAFIKWENQLMNSESHKHDLYLFNLFCKHKGKLEVKDLFKYKSKMDLEKALNNTSLNVNPVRRFEKDVSAWSGLKLNCDILYESNDWVILHSKDFESELKLSSGSYLCTTNKKTYDMYIEDGNYFFDFLDLKDNQKYFGTIGNMYIGEDFAGNEEFKTYYEILGKNHSVIMMKNLVDGKWVMDSYTRMVSIDKNKLDFMVRFTEEKIAPLQINI